MTLRKTFFKLVNNAVFGKIMENVRRHRDIKVVTTERRRNYFLSESSYHATVFNIENLFAIETRKTQIRMDKSVYLGLSILELSKMSMCKFWYYYVKQKYSEKTKLRFIINIKTDDIYKDIAEDVKSRYDTLNCEVDRPLSKGKK